MRQSIHPSIRIMGSVPSLLVTSGESSEQTPLAKKNRINVSAFVLNKEGLTIVREARAGINEPRKPEVSNVCNPLEGVTWQDVPKSRSGNLDNM